MGRAPGVRQATIGIDVETEQLLQRLMLFYPLATRNRVVHEAAMIGLRTMLASAEARQQPVTAKPPVLEAKPVQEDALYDELREAFGGENS